MGYKSHAQRKAVWASKKDGGKGNPNSPAKLVPTSLRKKRKTQEDVANEARKSYKNKSAKQMAEYRSKKTQAEVAARGKMSEKDMMKNEAKVYDTDGPNVNVYGKKKSPFKMEAKSPLMGKISASCKARAKKKFKVWPSAYASGWGVRCTQGKV